MQCQEMELSNRMEIQHRWIAGTLDDLHDAFNDDDQGPSDIKSIREQNKRIILNVGGKSLKVIIGKILFILTLPRSQTRGAVEDVANPSTFPAWSASLSQD